MNEVDQALKQKELMKLLKANGGFQYLVEQIEMQIKLRFDELLRYPTNAVDSIAGNLYTSGEIAGMKLIASFPDTLIDYAEATIAMDKQRTENEDAED